MRIVQLMQAAVLPAISFATKTEVFDNFWVDAYVDPEDLDYAIILLKMPPDTWMGLGLGTKNMELNSDMFQVDGKKKEVYDMYAVGNRAPELDG